MAKKKVTEVCQAPRAAILGLFAALGKFPLAKEFTNELMTKKVKKLVEELKGSKVSFKNKDAKETWSGLMEANKMGAEIEVVDDDEEDTDEDESEDEEEETPKSKKKGEKVKAKKGTKPVEVDDDDEDEDEEDSDSDDDEEDSDSDDDEEDDDSDEDEEDDDSDEEDDEESDDEDDDDSEDENDSEDEEDEDSEDEEDEDSEDDDSDEDDEESDEDDDDSEDEEEDEEESDDEESDEDDAPKKKGDGKKTGLYTGKPVIESILHFLELAGKEGEAYTRQVLLKKMVKEFPERDRVSLNSTISNQVPTRILNDKGIKVHGNSANGFYIKPIKKDTKTVSKKTDKKAVATTDKGKKTPAPGKPAKGADKGGKKVGGKKGK